MGCSATRVLQEQVLERLSFGDHCIEPRACRVRDAEDLIDRLLAIDSQSQVSGARIDDRPSRPERLLELLRRATQPNLDLAACGFQQVVNLSFGGNFPLLHDHDSVT